jgi:hypothetical protein
MKQKINLVIIILNLIVIFFSISYSSDKAGTTTAVFLKMLPGARPSGMGGAFTGICDDINSIYWNQSGLSQITTMELSGSYVKWIEGINSLVTEFVYPLKSVVLGFGLNYLSLGDIEIRDTNGQLADTNNSVYDSVVSIVISRKFSSKFSIGGAVKYITQKLGPFESNTIGLDFGLLYIIREDKFSTGLSLLNNAASMKIDEISNPIPMTIKLGVGYKLSPDLLIALDIDNTSDSDTHIHIGGEYKFKEMYKIRVGYNQIEGLTFGFGINTILKGEEFRMSSGSELGNELVIDYSVVSLGEFGLGHRISLGIKFK